MLVVTMNDIPGYEVEEVIGEVFGLTVRSRNWLSTIGTALRSAFGGELKAYTTMLIDSRQQGIQRLAEEAEAKGAERHHRHALRFGPARSTWNEICAYGTAVKVRKVEP